MNNRVSKGKTENDENFPVVFNLLPKDKKEHVLAFYHYARAADDIADSSSLGPEIKLAQLDEMEAVLSGKPPSDEDTQTAANFRKSLAKSNVPITHALDLLTAFRWDAVSRRYESWDDLMEYCRYSAQPVGRYLLNLHGETSSEAREASDALSSALQIINHIQDCRNDLNELGRLYVPTNWLDELKIPFETIKTTPAVGPMRHLFDLMLNGVGDLMGTAKNLPSKISNRALRAQAEVTLACGLKLEQKLRKQDPLSTRVELSTSEKLGMAMIGGFKGVFSP